MSFVTGKPRPRNPVRYVYFRDAYSDRIVWRLELFNDLVTNVLRDDDLRVSVAMRADTRDADPKWQHTACPIGISQYPPLTEGEVEGLFSKPIGVHITAEQLIKYRDDIGSLWSNIVASHKFKTPTDYKDPQPVKIELGLVGSFGEADVHVTAKAIPAKESRKVPAVQPESTPANTTDPATEAFYQDRLRAAREGVVLPTEIKMGWQRIDEDRAQKKRDADLQEMASLEDGTAIQRTGTYSRARYMDLIGYTDRKGTRK